MSSNRNRSRSPNRGRKKTNKRGKKQKTDYSLLILETIGNIFSSLKHYIWSLFTRQKGSLFKNRQFITVAAVSLLLIIGSLSAFLYWSFTNINAQEIYLNETKIGAMRWDKKKNADITDEYIQKFAITKLEDQLGTKVSVKEKVILKPLHVSKKDAIMTMDAVLTAVSKGFTYDVQAAIITVDGKEMATLASEASARTILDNIGKSYYQEGLNITNYEFVEKVDVLVKFVDRSKIMTADAAYSILSANSDSELSYVIKSGDTLDKIAYGANMTRDDLLKINPGYTKETLLKIGDTLTLIVPKPLLSVITYERVTYTEAIPKPVQKKENSAEYKTSSKVLQQGKDGQQEVTADIIRTNGYTTDKKIINIVITTEPITEITEVGTSNTRPKRALGVFLMPAAGRLTEQFHARGGNHDGIDIANSSGTPIYASDGGKVTFVGWQNGYGNLVIIDHGNGFETCYGHNSKILVTEGQNVAQGENVALMGSTGRSTGNHCHFEIRKNGAPEDPLNYIQ